VEKYETFSGITFLNTVVWSSVFQP